MDTYVIKRLEQAKLLTDPFKLKLLERFAGGGVTTKQVADRMGEKAPRLYRHVDALVEEGLLELVEEKPKRGTIERYYRTVADRFEVDPELFSTSQGGGDSAREMIRSLFRDTESDLLRLIADQAEGEPDSDSLPLVMKVVIGGTDEELAELREKLEAWLADCEKLADKYRDAEELATFTGLVAFYPRTEDD
jgi:predicted ArsR family transcriptional regulator